MSAHDKPLTDVIRDRAYELWEQEGRPDGRAYEFWERAREEVERALGEAHPSIVPPTTI